MKTAIGKCANGTRQGPIQPAPDNAGHTDDLACAQPGTRKFQLLAAGRDVTAAEFFAGIGLVRAGLEQARIRVVWANDIEPTKHAIYSSNFNGSEFKLCDIREVEGSSVPNVHIATASFPCVDLSLAGYRRGLDGKQSSLFFEFIRVLNEMGSRLPPVVMLENVPSLVSSNKGQDLRACIDVLNSLGYVCDVMVLDARWFVAQSRPRLFIIGTLDKIGQDHSAVPSPLRPKSVASFVKSNKDLTIQEVPVQEPVRVRHNLEDFIEHIEFDSERWWDASRKKRFLASLTPLHRQRLNLLRQGDAVQWRTAYRRMRNGSPVWEIRADNISGCLRASRGGSSRQAIAQISHENVNVRWMTPREYARLQGASDKFDFSSVSETQAISGFGDAVCVPVIKWLAEYVMIPAVLELIHIGNARTAV